jgi:hypothetical protein
MYFVCSKVDFKNVIILNMSNFYFCLYIVVGTHGTLCVCMCSCMYVQYIVYT